MLQTASIQFLREHLHEFLRCAFPLPTVHSLACSSSKHHTLCSVWERSVHFGIANFLQRFLQNQTPRPTVSNSSSWIRGSNTLSQHPTIRTGWTSPSFDSVAGTHPVILGLSAFCTSALSPPCHKKGFLVKAFNNSTTDLPPTWLIRTTSPSTSP